MFCQSCGAESLDAARFCNRCGTLLAPATTTSIVRRKPWFRSSRVLGIASAALVAVAAVGVFSDHPEGRKFLPTTAAEILGSYGKPPTLLRSYTTEDGATVRLYSSFCHNISLEERSGGLTRYEVQFEKYGESEPACGVVVAGRFGLFVIHSTAADPKDVLPIMDRLGGNNAWSPEPSETVVNGVKLTRYVKDGSLVLQADPD
jgi:hypothetical protein